MAKPAKKKTAKKSARMTAKPKASAKATKTAKKKTAKKKTAKTSRPAPRKTTKPRIDPLNRKQYTALTPMLVVKDVRAAAEFYAKAFGFRIRAIMDTPYGVMHAELRLRDATFMLSPESPERNSVGANAIGNTPVTLYILVDDVDAVVNAATAAGGIVTEPVTDKFWGDRTGMIKDPEGNNWMIATHKAEPTEAEMMEAMQKMMAQPQGGEAAAAAAAAAGSESEY